MKAAEFLAPNLFKKELNPFENVGEFIECIPFQDFSHFSTQEKQEINLEFEIYKQNLIESNYKIDLTEDLKEFWRKRLTAFPNFGPIVLRVLNSPVSSAEVERSFSSQNLLDSEHMKDEKLIKLNYIKRNYFNLVKVDERHEPKQESKKRKKKKTSKNY